MKQQIYYIGINLLILLILKFLVSKNISLNKKYHKIETRYKEVSLYLQAQQSKLLNSYIYTILIIKKYRSFILFYFQILKCHQIKLKYHYCFGNN